MIIEGAGAARRELMDLVDAVVWVQSDMAEAERRGIERDGGDAATVSFWHLWMAEELPFIGPTATVDTGERYRGGHARRSSRSGD